MRQKKFVVDFGWQVLFGDLGVSTQDLLRRAQLPLDLFAQKAPSLTTDEYFRLWGALEALMNDPVFPIKVVEAFSVEAFSPPIFACFCSPNLNTAVTRLAHYKPLIGPMTLDVKITSQATSIAFGGLKATHPLPSSLIVSEILFLTNIARMATRERIEPKSAHVTTHLPASKEFEKFLGCRIKKDTFNGVVFHAIDAQKPFLTANDSMWQVFKPELRTRLEELKTDARFRDRVRSCLIEILASGECSINDVTAKLAVSPRTLQRRLGEEGTSFQQVLNDLRRDLALFYLREKNLSGNEISFLLGYQEPSSFYRAFHSWTGKTPETMRANTQVTRPTSFP